jgi:hypothetical protein
MSFDDLGLLLGVIETRMVLHILVHGLWFPALQCDIFTYSVSILIHSLYAYLKCEIALVLAWSCSMYYNCYILYLASCAVWFVCCVWSASVILYLLLVWLDLFAACGVHWSDYTCLLCGLICSLLCVTMPWLRPMWFCHGVRLQYRYDFQLVGFYPCFEMSCPCDPHFSCCGWWVGFTCDRWWLFSLLWLLCLGHMGFDLLC